MRYSFVTKGGRRVVVRADDEDAARGKAAAKLDRRAEREGREPPVGWGLRLEEVSE